MALKQSNDSIILCPIFKWIYWESVNRFFIFNCWKRIVEFQWRWPSGYCAFIEYSSRWKSLKRSFVLEIWFFVFVWIIIDKVWPFKRCIFEHSKRRIVHSHYGIVYTHCRIVFGYEYSMTMLKSVNCVWFDQWNANHHFSFCLFTISIHH